MKRSVAACTAMFAALSSTACANHREFRVASVGAEGVPSGEAPASQPPAAVAPPVVASGNTLLGPVSRHARGSGAVPVGTVNGSVSSVLASTNQTLVQLTNGTSVLLDGAGAKLGDVVSIDLGAGRVVGGSTSLIGTAVTGGTNATGRLGITSATRTTTRVAGNLINSTTTSATRTVTAISSPVTSATRKVTNTLTGALKGCC